MGTRLPFAERCQMDGVRDQVGHLRLRVMARQLSVYAQAARLGVKGAADTAQTGWGVMAELFWSSKGWHAKVNDLGAAIDDTFSLYDQSFAIYACAHWAALTGSRDAVEKALSTLHLIDDRLRNPDGLGWKNVRHDAGFEQNGHMHFFEALLALHKVCPAPEVSQRIHALVDLLERHLFDPMRGVIPEWFDEHWQIDAARAIVEPGYQYEWAWLLKQAQGQGFVANIDACRLVDFAEAYGWSDDTAMIYDQCAPYGTVVKTDHRLWPHCEALRAMTIASVNDQQRQRANDIAHRMLSIFLDRPFAGGWVDHLNGEMQPIVETVPASSLYHLWEAAVALMQCGWATLPRDASC